MSLGENIKKYRKAQKITQKELAEMIGKNVRTVQGYEAGTVTIPLGVLEEIAEVFDTDIQCLMDTPKIMSEQYIENLEHIQTVLSDAAIYEQLAEECAELGQAALKLARFLRMENPTSVTLWEAERNFREETDDVLVCLDVIGHEPDRAFMEKKTNRWCDRLRKRKKEKNDLG